jgi:hypothetical protein
MYGATAHSGPRPPSNGASILLHFIMGQYSWTPEEPDKFQWQPLSSGIKEICTPVKAMELGHAQVRSQHTVFSLNL